jgi:hypothetical protein
MDYRLLTQSKGFAHNFSLVLRQKPLLGRCVGQKARSLRFKM